MSDLISRSALLEQFYCEKDVSSTLWGVEGIENLILNAPTVEAKPVVYGEWETVPNRVVEHGEVEIHGTAERCSNCFHASPDFKKYMLYCPNCGADMRGGKNE